MPLTYTQANAVTPGGPVSAADLGALAAAVNDRLLGGVGDCHWRLAYLMFSLFRQVRNSDASGTLFPPQAEFFNIYQAIDPADAEWPVTGPGDPEGSNLACQINAFVFGNEALDLASERDRIASVPVDLDRPDPDVPFTPSEYWELAKYQRGAWDPRTGAVASPMRELAQSYTFIRNSTTSPHGNSWGGYAPGPENAGGCAGISDGNGGYYYPPNRQVFFTNLVTGAVRSYDGTCPEQATHIAFIAYLPTAYLVFLNNGQVDYLPRAQWLEGPYTAEASLTKQSNAMLSRVVTEYAAEFRGTAEQQAERTWQNTAFHLHNFLNRQYPLAPQVGVQQGEYVVPKYPRWIARGSTALTVAGKTRLSGPQGAVVPFPAGTVCTGVLVTASRVRSPLRIQLRSGDTVVQEHRLEPGAGGAIEEIVWLDTPQRMTPMTVWLRDGLTFTEAAGTFTVEATCLQEYKPGKDDYYAVTRRASWNGEFFSPDGRGIDETLARQISDTLEDWGCLLPLDEGGATAPAGADAPLNQNAVFDAARRLSKCVRILPRQQLVGYAVVDGKSVLYLRRYAYGLHKATPADLLQGLAPALTELTAAELDEGKGYIVSAGRLTTNGRTYITGQTFTAGATVTGDGTAREADGIYRTPPKGGFSNRWCVDFTFKAYHPSVSSIWKPEAYADIFSPFHDRCTFGDPDAELDRDVILHFGFGQRPLYQAENPSGYRYAPTPLSSANDHINQILCGDPACEDTRARFYRSCRIYEPPVEVESAERVVGDYGEELVKLTLTGRLHHHHSLAPASLDYDIGTWDTADLLAESQDYATTENRLRQYLVHQSVGGQCDATGPGNAAYNSGIQTLPDNPFGSCYPTLLCTQLIPEPYRDGNTRGDAADAPAVSDHLRKVDLYLRAFCEGFIDGRTSTDLACSASTTTWFDYIWPNLWFDATGNRYSPLLPLSERPDNPEGHGAMPFTEKLADLFNGYVAAVNLLVRARVMLPFTLQLNYTETVNSRDVLAQIKTAAGNQPPGTWTDGSSDWAVWMTAPGGGGGTSTSSGWADGTTGSVIAGTDLDIQSPGAPATATLTHTTSSLAFRWNATNDIELACPETWRDYLSTSPEVLIQRESWTVRYRREVVSGASNGTQCSSVGPDTVWADGAGNAILWTGEESAHVVTCGLVNGGSVSSGPAPGGLVWHSDQEPDVDGTEFCAGGPLNVTNITAIQADVPAIRIPLVAYTAGS